MTLEDPEPVGLGLGLGLRLGVTGGEVTGVPGCRGEAGLAGGVDDKVSGGVGDSLRKVKAVSFIYLNKVTRTLSLPAPDLLNIRHTVWATFFSILVLLI